MNRRVFYVAHPVGGDVVGNTTRAKRWLHWLKVTFREETFVAPWIADLECGMNDSDPVQREAGLVDCETVVQRLTGIVLVGGRISTGMARECAVAREIVDLTQLGAEPPAQPYAANGFADVRGLAEYLAERELAAARKPVR